jgi:tetratricopeptide (TPR) repeat protein
MACNALPGWQAPKIPSVALAGGSDTLEATHLQALAIESSPMMSDVPSHELGPLYDQATELERSGDLPGAEKFYREIIAREPNAEEALLGLARVAERKRDYEQALHLYDAVLRQQPGHRAASLGRANVLTAIGRLPEALDSYQQLVKAFPHDSSIHERYADLLRRLDLDESRRRREREPPTKKTATRKAPTRKTSPERSSNDAGPSSSADEAPARPAEEAAKPIADAPKLEPEPRPEPSPVERGFLNDVVVARDGAASEPKLKFPEIAENIVALVQELAAKPQVVPATDPALPVAPRQAIDEPMITIGIFGPWGAGKSTLLKALRSGFERPGRDFPCILINSWKWDGKGDAHDFIRSEIRKYSRREMWRGRRALLPTLTANARILVRRYGQIALFALLVLAVGIVVWMSTATAGPAHVAFSTGVGLTIVAAASGLWNLVSPKLWDIAQKVVPSLLSEAGPSGLASAYRDILDLCGDKPFVVFIDDLDRCSADRVVSFVECVNNLTAIGCVTFIFCDDEFVAAAINSKYEGIIKYHRDKTDFGRRFLEKIVQIPFRIPAVDEAGIRELGLSSDGKPPSVEAQLPPVGPNPPTEGQTPPVVPPPKPTEPDSIPKVQLRQIIGDLLQEVVQPLGLNIRQVKTLSNTLKLYLDIAACTTERDAKRLAAFVFADRVDPEWLDALYHGQDLKESALGQLPNLPTQIKAMIGTDQKAMLVLYRMIGRRPVARRPAAANDPAAKDNAASKQEEKALA